MSMPATLSYSTQVFAAEAIAIALSWARHLGLKVVEVGRTHAQALHESEQAREQAKQLAADLGVRFGSLHAWTTTEGLGEVCPAAERIGARLVVVHCPHARLTEDFDGQVETLARWADWCGERGLILSVENSSRQPIDLFVRMFEAVPALKCTLDVKHAYKPTVFGLTHVDYMGRIGDRVANFHMLGIDPDRDDDLGDGIPAGNNPPGFSWRQLADDLRQRDYSALITVECSLHVRPEDEARLYYDLAPANDDALSLAHRLSRHNVAFFADLFAEVIEPLRPVKAG